MEVGIFPNGCPWNVTLAKLLMHPGRGLVNFGFPQMKERCTSSQLISFIYIHKKKPYRHALNN